MILATAIGYMIIMALCIGLAKIVEILDIDPWDVSILVLGLMAFGTFLWVCEILGQFVLKSLGIGG